VPGRARPSAGKYRVAQKARSDGRVPVRQSAVASALRMEEFCSPPFALVTPRARKTAHVSSHTGMASFAEDAPGFTGGIQFLF
jgi:hypothetical protein